MDEQQFCESKIATSPLHSAAGLVDSHPGARSAVFYHEHIKHQ
jgi:hypothetical protein